MEQALEFLQSWVPFFEALIWPGFILVLLVLARRWLGRDGSRWILGIFRAVKTRLEQGAEMRLGKEGLVLGEVKQRQEELEKEQRRIQKKTNSLESTVHSLASLLVTSPHRHPAFKAHVKKRVNREKRLVVSGTKFTEQKILCALISRLLADSESFAEVSTLYDFGGAVENFVALARGESDIFPAYTWMGFEIAYDTELAKLTDRFRSCTTEESIRHLNEIFENTPFPLTWVTGLGFSNNWEITMLREEAEKRGIQTLSDLTRSAGRMKLGCEAEFYFRTEAFGALRKPPPDGYGLRFGEICFLERGEIYPALEDGRVDVVDGFTTDPHLSAPHLTVLDDDRKRFGQYDAAIVIRKTLLSEFPELRQRLDRLTGRLDERRMRSMIQQVDAGGTDPEDVADTFLESADFTRHRRTRTAPGP